MDQSQLTRTPRDWRELIRGAKTKGEIISTLRSGGAAVPASRLAYLDGLAESEPGERPVNLESLRGSALFIMENPQLPEPQITVSYDGLVYLGWKLRNDGVLGMQFLPSALVRFTAALHRQDPKPRRRGVSGVLPPSEMMRTIAPFVEHCRSHEA